MLDDEYKPNWDTLKVHGTSSQCTSDGSVFKSGACGGIKSTQSRRGMLQKVSV